MGFEGDVWEGVRAAPNNVLWKSFWRFTPERSLFPHNTEQAFEPTVITTTFQVPPELYRAKVGIVVAHSTDQF